MIRIRRLALVLLCAFACGCASAAGGDKAGGSRSAPVVLRMAGVPANVGLVPPVADFARRVRALSRGAIRIDFLNSWGDFAPDAEVQVVRAVASGRVDLGVPASRVFDTLGVSSLQALSAPMLVDSYSAESAVVASDLPRRMLATLERLGVTGLAVLGDGLRVPIAVRGPLLGPQDWRGKVVGTYRSRVQARAISAWGATPLVAIGGYRAQALSAGRMQAFELDVRAYQALGLQRQAPYVTANVVLWPQFDVLLANPRRLASLTGQQRAWVEQAARQAARDSATLSSHDGAALRADCAAGARFARATPADLAALRRSAAAVYARLERDPETKAYIAAISRLKTRLTTPPGLAVPRGCLSRR